ncbi:hypothetical protein H312_01031, partial [Anncaliia algerae PRA339]
MENESSKEIENIGLICKSIMEDPETHIESLSLLQKSFEYKDWNYRSILFLSLTKLFKNIVPFYKIRTLKGKVKLGEEEDFISSFDKKLLKEYTYFINKLNQFDNSITYECAANLLTSLAHFNHSDKLITKILRGSLKKEFDHSQVIPKVIAQDKEGEITEMITNRMIDLEYNPKLLESFLLINLPDEKYKKVYDNILRIYFTILKEEKKSFLYFTYKGLIKYKDKIGKRYLEGLYLMLNNLLFKGDISSRIECINSILFIYGEREFDFKKIISSLFEMITPLKYYIKENESVTLSDLIRNMLILRRQNENRVVKFIHRLMQYSMHKYSYSFVTLVHELSVSYSVDLNENILIGKERYNYFSDDIDEIVEKRFTEH